jgi:hypothetical protein
VLQNDAAPERQICAPAVTALACELKGGPDRSVRSGLMADLRARVGELWRRLDEVDPQDTDAAAVIRETIDLLDCGDARVAEIVDDEVVVHEWLKQAILLLFRQAQMVTQELGPFEFADKIPLKSGYQAAGVRVVPGPRPAGVRSSTAVSSSCPAT